MKRTHIRTTLCAPILCGIVVGLACAFVAQPANAYDNELRAGAVLQVPFSLSGRSSFDPSKIRVGLSCQWANIEDDKVSITRTIDVTPPTPPNTVLNATVREDNGDQVYGLEGNLFIEVLNNFNGSAELLGFYGSNTIQGAAGAGFSMADGLFLDVKAMFPYSEVGLRFMKHFEIYGGGKTLGAFEPAQDNQTIDHRVVIVPAP